jgi:hypothetical protein
MQAPALGALLQHSVQLHIMSANLYVQLQSNTHLTVLHVVETPAEAVAAGAQVSCWPNIAAAAIGVLHITYALCSLSSAALLLMLHHLFFLALQGSARRSRAISCVSKGEHPALFCHFCAALQEAVCGCVLPGQRQAALVCDRGEWLAELLSCGLAE